jgi:hypothetical protein
MCAPLLAKCEADAGNEFGTAYETNNLKNE